MYKYCYSNEGAIYAKGLLSGIPEVKICANVLTCMVWLLYPSCKVCCIATNLIKIKLVCIHTHFHIKFGVISLQISSCQCAAYLICYNNNSSSHIVKFVHCCCYLLWDLIE